MRKPIMIRPLSTDERQGLQTGLHSSDPFVLRRSQILLASARGEHAKQIAEQVGRSDQQVRQVIHRFNSTGQTVLQQQSRRPHQLHPAFSEEAARQVDELLHRSPRDFGYPTSLWTLQLVAQVSFEQGLTTTLVSYESIRRLLKRLGLNWKRAKHWITSPDPLYQQKKKRRDQLVAWFLTQPNWVVGFLDEVWWNRFALPRLHAWQSEDEPIRLQEYATRSSDPDPKAFACYGVLWKQAEIAKRLSQELSLRFVTGRPVSEITTQFLDWCCAQLEAQGKTEWLLIWDNAPWHCSKQVYDWIAQHNRYVERERTGVKIVSCLLPSKSPWLNSIEPKWVHAKRAVVEPNRLLTASQLAERVCEYFQCPSQPPLSISNNVA